MSVFEAVDPSAAAADGGSAAVWVVESGPGRAAGALIREIRRVRPDAAVIVWDAGASQAEIAEQFRLGACDCFPAQSNPALLAERIDYICRRRRAPGLRAP